MAVGKQKIYPPFQWKWVIAAALILVVATVITYYPSLTYDFQFDDIYNIKKFFHLRIQSFREWAFGGARWISYALNSFHYKWGQHNPFVYRRSNLIFHTLTGLCMFFVTYLSLGRLRRAPGIPARALPIAFFTALLFLLHPVQTQTVSYVIQGQLEGLASLFMMAITLTYLLYQRASSWKVKVPLLLLMAVLGIFSCGTKEIAILSPLMLLLVDWFFISEGSFAELRKKWLFFIGFTLLIAIQYVRYLNFPFLKNSLLGTAVLANNVGNVITNPDQSINPITYFYSQFKVITHYLFMFLWPFDISVDYDWKMAPGFFTWQVIGPLLFLLLLGIGTIALLRKNKAHIVAFCSLWFFIGLAPRSTIIPSTELIADYKTYFSAFGMCLLLALAVIFGFEWAARKLTARTKHATACTLTSLCILLLSFATYQRNTIWRSSEEFWMSNIIHSPKKARAYNNYAVAIAEKERYKEAIPYLRKAIKMDPHYPDPWSNISVCYCRLGKIDVAIDCLRRALRINPYYAEFYNNLSSYLLTKQQYAEVKTLAEQAIKIRPYYGKAHFNLGQALYGLGQEEEAHKCIKFACMNADYEAAEAYKSYAELSVHLKKYEDALTGFTKLAQVAPQDPDVQFNIANALYCLNRFDEAKQTYLTLLKRNPDEFRVWMNLAEVYINEKNFSEAQKCYERAQPLAPQYPEVMTRLAQCKTYAEKSNQLS